MLKLLFPTHEDPIVPFSKLEEVPSVSESAPPIGRKVKNKNKARFLQTGSEKRDLKRANMMVDQRTERESLWGIPSPSESAPPKEKVRDRKKDQLLHDAVEKMI